MDAKQNPAETPAGAMGCPCPVQPAKREALGAEPPATDLTAHIDGLRPRTYGADREALAQAESPMSLDERFKSLSEDAREALRSGLFSGIDDPVSDELIRAGLAIWTPRLECTPEGVAAHAALQDKGSAADLAAVIDESEEIDGALGYLDGCVDEDFLDGFAVDAEAASSIVAAARDKIEAALTECADAIRALPESSNVS